MRFRHKLFLSFIIVILISSLLTMGLLYRFSYNTLFVYLDKELAAITTTFASIIDGELVEQLASSKTKNSVDYKKLSEELSILRILNSGENLSLDYVAITKNNLVILDSGEQPASFSILSLKKRSSNVLQSVAPIFDSSHNKIGLLVVSAKIDNFYTKLHTILYQNLSGSFVAIVLAMILAYILYKITTRSLDQIKSVILQIKEGHFEARVFLDSEDEFDDLALAVNSMAKGISEREKLKKGFASYVSSFVLETLLNSGKQTKLTGERKKLTILFSDIRQFITLAETLPPEEVVKLVNDYLKVMIDVIFKHHGTLDQFIVDGIMVEFGAPLDDPNQEKNAALAALEMQQEIKKFNESLSSIGKPTLDIGIGIHTGFAVIGNIGSSLKMGYTAIGDTVNVASRLEKATRDYTHNILISDITKEGLGSDFQCEEIGDIYLHGREKPIRAFALKS